MKKMQFLTLGGNSIRETQISDHEPVIKQRSLSWNIMMPGKFRNNRYNNGFGLVESQEQYHARLKIIAGVLAEMIHQNPHVSMISLQEGPVQSEDIEVFVKSCAQFESLKQFLPSLNDPTVYTNWGLISLVDSSRFDYTIDIVSEAQGHLENRIQRLNLTDRSSWQSVVLTNLHLPYQGKQEPFKAAKLIYSMMKKIKSNFVLMGDFNFSFTEDQISTLMSRLGKVFAPLHNSTEVQLENGGTNTLETVDAIISNRKESDHSFCNLNLTSLLRFTRAYKTISDTQEPSIVFAMSPV